MILHSSAPQPRRGLGLYKSVGCEARRPAAASGAKLAQNCRQNLSGCSGLHSTVHHNRVLLSLLLVWPRFWKEQFKFIKVCQKILQS